MILFEPTQKYMSAFPDGEVSKNYKFWFNVDLLFIATSNGTDEQKLEKFTHYANNFGLELTYEYFMSNFNIPFSVLIKEFKDTPGIYNSFNFKG